MTVAFYQPFDAYPLPKKHGFLNTATFRRPKASWVPTTPDARRRPEHPCIFQLVHPSIPSAIGWLISHSYFQTMMIRTGCHPGRRPDAWGERSRKQVESVIKKMDAYSSYLCASAISMAAENHRPHRTAE
jgi:hypothetical protein